MRTFAASLAVVLAAALGPAAGCTEVAPPSAIQTEEGEQQEPELPALPEDVSADVYERESHTAGAHPSRYLLIDDNTFELQILSERGDLLSYPGSYSRSNDTLTFRFEAFSTAGPWEATGTFEDGGTRLRVEYNIVMWLSDFENGVYVRVD